MISIPWIKSKSVVFLERIWQYITYIPINCFDYCVLSLCSHLPRKVALWTLFSKTSPSLLASDQIWYFKLTLSLYGSLQVKRSFFALRGKWWDSKMKKTLIWYGRSNWHAGQILTLKDLWNTDFEIFTAILKLKLI